MSLSGPGHVRDACSQLTCLEKSSADGLMNLCMACPSMQNGLTHASFHDMRCALTKPHALRFLSLLGLNMPVSECHLACSRVHVQPSLAVNVTHLCKLVVGRAQLLALALALYVSSLVVTLLKLTIGVHGRIALTHGLRFCP